MLAKGVNFVVPHGTWYENTKDVVFPPELSYRSARFGAEMPAYLKNTLEWMAYYGGTNNPRVTDSGNPQSYNLPVGCNSEPAVPGDCARRRGGG